jgi:hypothetical protein
MMPVSSGKVNWVILNRIKDLSSESILKMSTVHIESTH